LPPPESAARNAMKPDEDRAMTGGALKPHPLECLDVGFFPRDHLPEPLAGSGLWVEMAFAAITRAYDCPKPLIAAVNGVAAGGGFEIALACDILVAADNARFGLPEPRVGLIAGAGGIHRLSRQIPLKQAMGMLLTGRLVSADEGYRLGFVNEIVPAAELMAAAQRWAGEILECSPLLVQLTKESAHDGFGRPVDEAIARDWHDRIPRLLASQDYVEGPKAFSERRKPVWTGS